LPERRRQGREVSRQGSASAFSRARGTRHHRAVCERALHELAGASAAGSDAPCVGTRAGAHDTRRLRHRVRLLSAHAARRIARLARHSWFVLRRSGEWHDGLRRSGRPRCDRGHQRGPLHAGSRAARPGTRDELHRGAGERSRHARRGRALPAFHLTERIPSHRAAGQCARAARAHRRNPRAAHRPGARGHGHAVGGGA